jgi:alpha-ketoglutarate-dependent taurine dioxygenase
VTTPIEPSRAWRRDSLSPADWIVPVPPACLREIDDLVGRLREQPPAAVESLTPEPFALSACAELMAGVRDRLAAGPGLAVVDRVPVERYTEAERKAIGWLLAGMISRIVNQKWTGTRLYDVKDSGQALGYGVRRSVTNLGQPFHTDGPWLWKPPRFIGLFCLETALEGGLSRVVSLATAHEALERRHAALLPRLYRPFLWDRQAEHGPGDARSAAHPVFAVEGGALTARYYDDYIASGQALAGEPLDAEGADALAAMRAVVDDPEHRVEFRVEPGQLQYLNNRQLAHSRTAFKDSAQPGHVRHMLRLWNRDEGTIDIEGRPPA